MLTKNEWELLGGLCVVLKEFAEAITYLGASKYVTHSIMSPLLKKIKKYIKPENTRSQNIDIEKIADIFAEKEKEKKAECKNIQNISRERLNLNELFNITKMLKKVKLNLYNAMELYWGKEEEETLISALLDPRIKSLEFIDDDEVRDKTKDLLKNKYDQLKADSSLTAPATPSTSLFGQSSLFSIFKRKIPQDNEVTTYLSLPELDFDSNPFTWWCGHREQFPILSKLARIYLPIPATSTPSERLFSDAGNLLTAKRTRLNPELFNRLMFLKKNSLFVKSIHPSPRNL